MLITAVYVFLIFSLALIMCVWGIKKNYLKNPLFGTLSILLFMLVLFFSICTLIVYVEEYPLMVLATPDYNNLEYQVHLVLERLNQKNLTLNEYHVLNHWLEYMFAVPDLTDAEKEFLILVDNKLKSMRLTPV